MHEGRGWLIDAGSGTNSGAVGEALRPATRHQLGRTRIDPTVVDGLRHWTTSTTLETEQTVAGVAKACTMVNGKEVEPDQLQHAELLKSSLRENSVIVYALHCIIVEV